MTNFSNLTELTNNQLRDVIKEANRLLSDSGQLKKLPTKILEPLKKAYDEVLNFEVSADSNINTMVNVTVGIDLSYKTGEVVTFLEDVDYDDDEFVEEAEKIGDVKKAIAEAKALWRRYDSLLGQAAKHLGLSKDVVVALLEEI